MKWNVKAIRARLGMTQSEMAVKLGISTSSYASKEAGKSDFTFREVKTICEMSNISLDDISTD